MANFLKKLKIANAQTNKVLVTDANGIIVPSSKAINELVTTDVTGALDNRVTALETSIGDIAQRLHNING